MVFAFNAQANSGQMICDTVEAIGGSVCSRSDTVIEAKWRSNKYITVFPTKFKFYIGRDMVRVTCRNSSSDGIILVNCGIGGAEERVWMVFVDKLLELYPSVDFGLKSAPIMLESIKILSDGVEQVMTTSAFTNYHLFGPDMTYAASTSKSGFSKELLATAIYSNGRIINGEIVRDSSTYHEIMASMSKFQK